MSYMVACIPTVQEVETGGFHVQCQPNICYIVS